MAFVRRFSKFAMVDVGSKPIQKRTAVAMAIVSFPSSIWDQVLQGSKKGDAIAMAEIAGIQGAKSVPSLLPMCHTLALDSVRISILPQSSAYRVESTVTCHGKTGVEMEALTAVSAASLCLYDCFKYLSSDILISEIQLLSKTKQHV
jgi:cyclic pyranopterin phosphate synthase